MWVPLLASSLRHDRFDNRMAALFLSVPVLLFGEFLFIFSCPRIIQGGQLINGLTVCSGHQMAIHVHRQFYAAVTKLVLNVGQRLPILYQQ